VDGVERCVTVGYDSQEECDAFCEDHPHHAVCEHCLVYVDEIAEAYVCMIQRCQVVCDKLCAVENSLSISSFSDNGLH
jgi:hypothetical protein